MSLYFTVVENNRTKKYTEYLIKYTWIQVITTIL